MKSNTRSSMWLAIAFSAFALTTSAFAQWSWGDRDRDGDRDGGRGGYGYDDGYYRQLNADRRQAYEQGYQSGFRKGLEERREGDYHGWRESDCGRRVDRDHDGDDRAINQAFSNGCRAGFADAYSGRGARFGGFGYGDGDDYGNRGGYGYGNAGQVARQFGYQDGASVAAEDLQKRKPYNPNPRGRYDDADHGYRHEFGDKGWYKQQYSQAYRQGYEQEYQRLQGQYGGWRR